MNYYLKSTFLLLLLNFQELVKYSKKEDPDTVHLVAALSTMHTVAQEINVRKREAENLEQMHVIQQKLIGMQKKNLPVHFF